MKKERDWSELEGKEIEVDMYGKKVVGLVVGCERGIGITIVNKEDKENYLVCFYKRPREEWNEIGDNLFDKIVEMLDEGVYSFERIERAAKKLGVNIANDIGPQTCIFAQ